MRINKRGFTLVELLVVATIISLLAAAGIVSYTSLNRQSRDARRKADLENIRSALEQYRAEASDGRYPITNSYSALSTSLVSGTTQYINQLPADPVSTRSYFYTSATGATYDLCAAFDIDPGSNVTGCGSCGSGVVCNYRLTPLGIQ